MCDRMHRRFPLLLGIFLCAMFSVSAQAKSKKADREASSADEAAAEDDANQPATIARHAPVPCPMSARALEGNPGDTQVILCPAQCMGPLVWGTDVYADDSARSEEHTSELQSRGHLVCRLLLEKKKTIVYIRIWADHTESS